MRTDPLLRFRQKYAANESGCWIWQGNLGSNGYPLFWSGEGRCHTIAHRWAYSRFVGSIPADHDVDHLCQEKRCVNPDHLEAVTHRENVRRQRSLVTHCPRGHPYAGENLIVRKRGDRTERQCRTCTRMWQREHDKKRRGSAVTGA